MMEEPVEPDAADTSSPDPPAGGSTYDVTIEDYILPLFGLGLFSLPVGLALMPDVVGPFEGVVRPYLRSFWVRVAVVFGLPAVGVALFAYNAAKAGDQDTHLDEWPAVERVVSGVGEDRHETLLTEYETIAAEARYRDGLLFRVGYFSLAGFAVLMTILVRVQEPKFQAGVALVGTLVSLVFAIAAVSYKDSRDPLWERMRVIELHERYKNDLTSFHTIRTHGERRLYDQLSLSGYIVNLQIFFQILWLGVYLITAWLAVSNVIGVS